MPKKWKLYPLGIRMIYVRPDGKKIPVTLKDYAGEEKGGQKIIQQGGGYLCVVDDGTIIACNHDELKPPED